MLDERRRPTLRELIRPGVARRRLCRNEGSCACAQHRTNWFIAERNRYGSAAKGTRKRAAAKTAVRVRHAVPSQHRIVPAMPHRPSDRRAAPRHGTEYADDPLTHYPYHPATPKHRSSKDRSARRQPARGGGATSRESVDGIRMRGRTSTRASGLSRRRVVRARRGARTPAASLGRSRRRASARRTSRCEHRRARPAQARPRALSRAARTRCSLPTPARRCRHRGREPRRRWRRCARPRASATRATRAVLRRRRAAELSAAAQRRMSAAGVRPRSSARVTRGRRVFERGSICAPPTTVVTGAADAAHRGQRCPPPGRRRRCRRRRRRRAAARRLPVGNARPAAALQALAPRREALAAASAAAAVSSPSPAPRRTR